MILTILNVIAAPVLATNFFPACWPQDCEQFRVGVTGLARHIEHSLRNCRRVNICY